MSKFKSVVQQTPAQLMEDAVTGKITASEYWCGLYQLQGVELLNLKAENKKLRGNRNGY